jgi:hypothetical protein
LISHIKINFRQSSKLSKSPHGNCPRSSAFTFYSSLPFADLFRSVAAMSGAEVSYHSTIGKPALAFNNTIRLGRYLGCVHPVASEVWACILTRSTNDIVQAVSPTTVPSIPVN